MLMVIGQVSNFNATCQIGHVVCELCIAKCLRCASTSGHPQISLNHTALDNAVPVADPALVPQNNGMQYNVNVMGTR